MQTNTNLTVGTNGSDPAAEQQPERVKIATVPTYDEATDAIEWLSSARFPVERTTIVARDLKLVERVVGIRTRWRAAGDGAATGVVVGAGVGLVLGALGDGGVLGSLFWGAVFGAGIGAVLAAVLHALASRRPFESVSTLDAEFYDVLVEERVAPEAVGLLTEWAVKDPARRLETQVSEPALVREAGS